MNIIILFIYSLVSVFLVSCILVFEFLTLEIKVTLWVLFRSKVSLICRDILVVHDLQAHILIQLRVDWIVFIT